MKSVSSELNTYLNTEKSIQSCDLYELLLPSGVNYYFADRDTNVDYMGHSYKAVSAPIVSRTQIKTSGDVSVDKLTVTIYASKEDTIMGVPVLQIGHNGGFDGAVLHLRRAFFNTTGAVLGHVDLFSGECNLKQGGGLQVQLEVKSEVQKLNTEWPMRKYYPQCPYTLFDADCGVDINRFKKRCKVVGVPNYNTVTVNIGVPDNEYNSGGIEWLSGALVGQSTQIVQSVNGQLRFISSNGAQPKAGDECYIYVGCDKTPECCRNRFNNWSHNRATPYVPRKESIQ